MVYIYICVQYDDMDITDLGAEWMADIQMRFSRDDTNRGFEGGTKEKMSYNVGL